MSAGRSSRVRCKPGDRCRIIGGAKGVPFTNAGRVVVVLHRADDGKTAANGGPAWHVMALGAPLRTYSRFVDTGKFAREKEPSMTADIEDARLVPLDDDDDGIQESAQRRAPRSTPVPEEVPA